MSCLVPKLPPEQGGASFLINTRAPCALLVVSMNSHLVDRKRNRWHPDIIMKNKINPAQLHTETVDKRSLYTKCGSLAVKIMNGSHREICQDHYVISFEKILWHFCLKYAKTKRFTHQLVKPSQTSNGT